MKTSSILRAAKPYLGRAMNRGVCTAAACARREGHMDYSDELALCRAIDDLIKPFPYATDWLAYVVTTGRQPPRAPSQVSHKQYHQLRAWKHAQPVEALQDWRHRWVDRLIAEFEAKGD